MHLPERVYTSSRSKLLLTKTYPSKMVSFNQVRHHLIGIAITLLCCTNQATASEEPESYGVDVSFPIFKRISTNYEWLPHNTDPSMNPTPKQFEGMPLQPLGNRQAMYNNHLLSCREYYRSEKHKCDIYEYDRMLMNQRQPQR